MNFERSTQSNNASDSNTFQARGVLQRKCACSQHQSGGGECTACKNNRLNLQRKTDTATDNTTDVPPIVHEVLNSPGSPLDSNTRNYMESRFVNNFSQVRVHTDSKAAESAKAVDALAYTVGPNVVFGAGHYSPGQKTGMRLLAHELTHVVQQQQVHHQGVMNRSIEIGPEDSQAEIEADRVADDVINEHSMPFAPEINSSPAGGIALQRVPTTPQRRGGEQRLATIEAPARGEDQVRIRIFRYLCDCMGRNVSRSRLSARIQPRPGIVYQFCRGRTTVRVLGEVVPSSLTSGTATATVDINVAPERGGTGGRVQIQGEARNTGNEPQVGGRVRGTIETPSGSPDITAGGEIFAGTETGQLETQVGGGVRIGGTSITLGVTNPQDRRRGVMLGVGRSFGGPEVQEDICRECVCPVAYDCLEDIPPRAYEEEVPFTTHERSRFRYYFQYNTSRDARSPGLRAESTRSMDRLVQTVSSGAEISSIRGYASPEAGEATRNLELSTQRAERLREIVALRLGQNTAIPASEPGGELLGSVPTITPGSGLSDAILDTGFGDAEDVSSFLFGQEIADDQLADQFLALLGRVTEPVDRLRLFGISENSPTAGQLLAAIEQFIARRGRGRRPWERVFEFLRFATVEVIETVQGTRTEERRTRGSLRPMGEALCNRYSQQAEDAGLFGPTEREPTQSECPLVDPVNPEQYADKCDYS